MITQRNLFIFVHVPGKIGTTVMKIIEGNIINEMNQTFHLIYYRTPENKAIIIKCLNIRILMD